MDKNTKKKESKAHINAILEKYNLKAPKKTQIQDKKQDYQIKPKSNSSDDFWKPKYTQRELRGFCPNNLMPF